MADGVDGKLEFQTLLNNDKLKSGIAEMGKIANKGAATIGKITKAGATATVAAIGTATTAATALVKKSVENYAQYEQLVGGVETLFGAGGQSLEEYAASVGKSTDEVEDKYNSLMSAQTTVMADAANAYKTAGMSANDYMDTVTSFSASLVASLGGDTEKAADYSNRAITDMADNANKMGTNIQDIQHAYQGFAKQNYTMLDNLKLGYGGTKEEMQRLIADASEMTDVQEKLGLTVDSSSLSFGNIVNAISVMQENMGIAGTTAKEAATTIEGSVNMMKASWENLVTGMADDNADFDTLMQQFVDSTVTATDNLLPRIQIAIEGIGKLIEQLLPVIMDKVPQIIADTLPGLISAGISMVSALAQGIMDYAPQLISYAAELLVQFVQGLVTALPQIIEFAGELVQTLVTSFTEAAPQLMEAGSQLIEFLGTAIYEYIPQMLQYGAGLIENLISGFVEGIPEYLPQALQFLQDFGDYLAEKAPDIIQWGFDMLSQLVDGIISALPILIDQLPQIIITFANIINDNFPTILKKGVELLWQLIKGIISCIPKLIENMPKIVEAIVSVIEAFNWLNLGRKIITFFKDGIMNLVSAVGGAGKSVYNAVKNAIINLPSTLAGIGRTATKGLGNAMTSLGSFIKSSAFKIGEHIISGFKSLPKKVLSIGKNIVKGLWNGISDMTGWVVDKITGFASGIIDTAKDVLGIHSPSRKFKWIGEMCVEGFDEPIDDYNPYDTLNKSIKANAGVMKANFVGSGSYAENYTAVYDYEAAAEATANALKGMTVNIDGRRAGKLLAPTIDKYQGEISQKRT